MSKRLFDIKDLPSSKKIFDIDKMTRIVLPLNMIHDDFSLFDVTPGDEYVEVEIVVLPSVPDTEPEGLVEADDKRDAPLAAEEVQKLADLPEKDNPSYDVKVVKIPQDELERTFETLFSANDEDSTLLYSVYLKEVERKGTLEYFRKRLRKDPEFNKTVMAEYNSISGMDAVKAYEYLEKVRQLATDLYKDTKTRDTATYHKAKDSFYGIIVAQAIVQGDVPPVLRYYTPKSAPANDELTKRAAEYQKTRAAILSPPPSRKSFVKQKVMVSQKDAVALKNKASKQTELVTNKKGKLVPKYVS